MYRNWINNTQRSRLLAAILGANLLAGCQPGGTGSITVDRKDPAVRRLKTFEDVKAPKTARTSKKPASTKSVPRAGLK
jgi:hypothetical protein